MSVAAPAVNRPDGWTLTLPGDRRLALGDRPLVMGVLNVTPDSFSDGGRWLDPERAVERALVMIAAGADLIDIGAESTRPAGRDYGEGADFVGAAEEIDRLLPVVDLVRAATDRPVSVDTRKGAVARAALDAGADLVNDVSALADDELAAAVAAAGCPVILMHSRGDVRDMQSMTDYDDVVTDVRGELAGRLERAREAGIAVEQTIVDPGIGFAKTADQNLRLLGRLDELASLRRPILVGASRKSFIGRLTGQPAPERLAGSLAAVAWSAFHRVAMIRVHDVEETVRFLAVWRAVAEAAQERETA